MALQHRNHMKTDVFHSTSSTTKFAPPSERVKEKGESSSSSSNQSFRSLIELVT